MSTDRWLAVMAGPNTWRESHRPVTVAVRAIGGLEAFALFASTLAVLTFHLTSGVDSRTSIERTAMVGIVVITILSSIGPLGLLVGRPNRAMPLWSNLTRRSVVGIAMVISIYSLAPGWASLLSWPVGITVGADAALAAHAVGGRPSPWQWWTSLLKSPMHFGVIGGLVGVTITSSRTSVLGIALPVYLTTQVWAGLACCTAWSARRLLAAEDSGFEAVRLNTVRDEHRRSAHWLHDDICAQLRLVTLKVQRSQDQGNEVVAMLDDLDFSLRLRHLDELLDSGTVRLAEVLQPFVRQAQNHGVSVEQVPSYETAAMTIDRDTGQKIRRAAAVLTSNALNAGADRVGYEVDIADDHIRLSVTDDAGGFDRSTVDRGRGLWGLEHELGDGAVEVERLDDGSRVTATVHTTIGRDHGAAAPRR